MDNLALQLWSVKDSMEKDVKSTLKAVAELGFKGVEFAGFFDTPASEMKSILDELGIKVAGSHTGFGDIVNNLDEIIDYNKIIGNKNIVCPHYDLKDERSLEELVDGLKSALPKLVENGMSLHYHNHNHEFAKIGDKYLLDMLYEQFSELKPEIDTYWVYNAGVDVESYCMKYKGRCGLVHLKDGTKTSSTPVGYGEVDIKTVIATAKNIGVQWVIMEDETWNPDGLTCVAKGMDSLKKLESR